MYNRIFSLAILLLLRCFSLNAHAQTTYITIPAGNYTLGKKDHQLNPLRNVQVEEFSIASKELTNAAFEEFVLATNYITDAERLKNALVFEPGLEEFKWKEDSTAYWRFPNGVANGGIEYKMNHPVTTISYKDALAYCAWAKVRLPSLDEWEVASRAHSSDTYFWGNDKTAIAEYANIWHGRNHLVADSSDGYMYTAPVGSFKPNELGLYDMYGNVFEFCEGILPNNKDKKNIVHARGGSWWCSKNACNFYNSVDIGRVHQRASFSNQGFRVVKLN